jgi:hypothetical protein
MWTDLTRAVSSSTANTWNTRNGTTSTPGLGGCLVTSILSDGVSLALVFGNTLCESKD